jgi:signal transduction histidine kinase
VLHAFLSENRLTLIERCRQIVAARADTNGASDKLLYGVPVFLDQVIETLVVERRSAATGSGRVSRSWSGEAVSEIGATATRHGRELAKHGFSLDQAVRDYGDVCQAITNLACDRNVSIEVGEFRTLNRCLDNAIADAVTEYALQDRRSVAEDGVQALNARLGSLAHELRNHVNTVTLALKAMRTGTVGLTGATGDVLDRSLASIRTLIDRSLADVRVTAGLAARPELIDVAAFVAETGASATLDARARDCQFIIAEVDKSLTVYADREMLHSAVGNLLQNAFKFTQHNTVVSLHASMSGGRVVIEVADHCGGLPHGGVDKMFAPFQQRGDDRSGLGLGLDICRRAVGANDGTLRVRDIPGIGCVFAIDLPPQSLG